MERKPFNPKDWIPIPATTTRTSATKHQSKASSMKQVEEVVQKIEEMSLDLTVSHKNWVSIGFAFEDEFKEDGRTLFHRVSRFHPEYSPGKCDAQYDACLNSNKDGITIATFFYLAKDAGIQITTQKANTMNLNGSKNGDQEHTQLLPQVDDQDAKEEMPTFPDSIFSDPPELIQDVVKYASSNEERDILLLGSLACFSACLPNLYGIYDNRKVYPNQYLYVTAQASAGKGKLEHCRKLVEPIHKSLRIEAKKLQKQYEAEMSEFAQQKGKKKSSDKPVKPPEKMLFIPANNSSTGAYQLLHDNDGRGLIFETEGDTLAQAFKTDYGNYSDGFRKAFHHETISYYRRTDREYVEIPYPCLATLLCGTFKQVPALIPSAENGLLSRFIFYCMNLRPGWKNVFETLCDQGLDEYFDSLGVQFYELYKLLLDSPPIQFAFTVDQEERFNNEFSKVQEAYLLLQGLDYMATVRRLGLITFRISMVLSALRIMETGEIKKKIICEDRDFEIAMSMMRILVKHSAKVFSELPMDAKPTKRKNRKERFLDALPKQFNRKGYLEVAKMDGNNINEKTAEGYITAFIKAGLLHRDSQDNYMKFSNEDSKEIKDIKESSEPQHP